MPEVKRIPMIPPGGWLKHGAVPAGTICPFRVICSIAKEGACGHKSQEHTTDYSCGAARAFALCIDYNKLRQPKG